MKIKSFTFNVFQENTYVIYDDTQECIIIDPGCYEEEEKNDCMIEILFLLVMYMLVCSTEAQEY